MDLTKIPQRREVIQRIAQRYALGQEVAAGELDSAMNELQHAVADGYIRRINSLTAQNDLLRRQNTYLSSYNEIPTITGVP